MRTDVTFKSGGLTCKGWFYRPDGPKKTKRPVMVYCNGMGAIMSGGTGARFSELFSEQGYCALTFDYRYSGLSEGSPRGRAIPSLQHDDIRAAIGFALEQDDVDPNKVILEGASYGGAHAMFVGALDPRVNAVIAIVAGLGARHLLENRKVWDSLCKQFTADFVERNSGGKDELYPIVAPPGEPCLLPYPDCYEWIMKNSSNEPSWINGITRESRLRSLEYTPTAFIDAISPRPLLMFAAENDSLLPVPIQRAAFDRAHEPKRFELLPCGHFEVYDPGPVRDRAMAIKMEWLEEHGLGP